MLLTRLNMDFGEFLGLLFKKENKTLQRILGSFLLCMPLAYCIGGGFEKPIDSGGIPFSSGWFREIFAVGLTLMSLFGAVLLLVSFSKKTRENEEFIN